jgi:hypothetical protein
VLPEPDPTACCPDAYYCPTTGETECPRHGGFTVCCDAPARHVPLDPAAWHLAQEHLEQQLLATFLNRRDLYRGKDPETARRMLFGE